MGRVLLCGKSETLLLSTPLNFKAVGRGWKPRPGTSRRRASDCTGQGRKPKMIAEPFSARSPGPEALQADRCKKLDGRIGRRLLRPLLVRGIAEIKCQPSGTRVQVETNRGHGQRFE